MTKITLPQEATPPEWRCCRCGSPPPFLCNCATNVAWRGIESAWKSDISPTQASDLAAQVAASMTSLQQLRDRVAARRATHQSIGFIDMICGRRAAASERAWAANALHDVLIEIDALIAKENNNDPTKPATN